MIANSQQPECSIKKETEENKIPECSDNKIEDKKNIDCFNDIEGMIPNGMPTECLPQYKLFLKKIEEFQKPALETLQPDMLASFQHYNIRYFENRYSLHTFNNQCHDMLVRVHTNKSLLLSLAEGHYIFQQNKNVSEVSFIINDSDKSKIQTSGKKKYGSRPVDKVMVICKIRLEGEDEWHSVRAGVPGYMLEVNDNLKCNPNCIKTDIYGMGYIALLLPKGRVRDLESTVEKLQLLTSEEYFKHLSERSLNVSVDKKECIE